MCPSFLCSSKRNEAKKGRRGEDFLLYLASDCLAEPLRTKGGVSAHESLGKIQDRKYFEAGELSKKNYENIQRPYCEITLEWKIKTIKN